MSEQRMIERLREDYVADHMDLAEFERRVDRVLRGDPTPVDVVREAEDARREYIVECYS